MKRLIFALILITACVLSQAVICFSEEAAPVSYQMEIEILEAEQAANIRAVVKYKNQTGQTLENLLFSIPANCFRRESTLPYDNETLESAFPFGYAPGGADIRSIRVDGKDALWAVSGENEAYIRVPVSLENGEFCTVQFDYALLLTQNNAFLGVSDLDLRFSGFYPSLLVFEDGDFASNALTRAGKSHYSDVCSFEISVNMPVDYDIACSGERSESVSGSRKNASFRLENAREAAFVISRKFHTVSAQTASGVLVSAYGQNRSEMRKAVSRAVSAIEYFEKTIAPFPHAAFTLAYADLAGQNLSASGISLIAKGGAGKEEIYKQVALQYFSDRAHPNPAMEAWLTDGLSEYMAYLCVRDTEGEGEFLRLMQKSVLPSLQITIPGGLTPVSATNRFQTLSEYEAVVSLRGAAALHEVQTAMGQNAFLSGVKQYYEENAYKTPVSDDFARAFENATARSWADAIYHWLYTIGDYQGENLYEYD
ncbi:MAG: hypothetical protein IKJ65_04695 [Clostridia bacterium]|nr:hypothetical protein [Clostridia bacterium]